MTGTTAAGAAGAPRVTGTMIGGEVMTTSEVAVEVGITMTGTMEDIPTVLQIGMIQGMGRPMMVQGSPKGKA